MSCNHTFDLKSMDNLVKIDYSTLVNPGTQYCKFRNKWCKFSPFELCENCRLIISFCDICCYPDANMYCDVDSEIELTSLPQDVMMKLSATLGLYQKCAQNLEKVQNYKIKRDIIEKCKKEISTVLRKLASKTLAQAQAWELYYTPEIKKPRVCESNCKNLVDATKVKYNTGHGHRETDYSSWKYCRECWRIYSHSSSGDWY